MWLIGLLEEYVDHSGSSCWTLFNLAGLVLNLIASCWMIYVGVPD